VLIVCRKQAGRKTFLPCAPSALRPARFLFFLLCHAPCAPPCPARRFFSLSPVNTKVVAVFWHRDTASNRPEIFPFGWDRAIVTCPPIAVRIEPRDSPHAPRKFHKIKISHVLSFLIEGPMRVDRIYRSAWGRGSITPWRPAKGTRPGSERPDECHTRPAIPARPQPTGHSA
jgi:hypothetical protein